MRWSRVKASVELLSAIVDPTVQCADFIKTFARLRNHRRSTIVALIIQLQFDKRYFIFNSSRSLSKVPR